MGYLQKINVMGKMRDGVKLSFDIRMPDKGGPFPAVLERNPYNNNFLITPENERYLKLYLDAGYAHVSQDTRGKYDSEGEFKPFEEAEDGYDSVEWVAKQPWCNGKVGMTGASYVGLTALAAAQLAPPSLCAITPSVMGEDIFKRGVYNNGVLKLGFISWMFGNNGRTDKPEPLLEWNRIYNTLPPKKMDETAGFESKFFDEVFTYPINDKRWNTMSIVSRYRNFKAPVFLLGGWYDTTVIRVYLGLKKEGKIAKMLIGPWTHGLSRNRVVGQIDFGGHSLIDVEATKRRWLDRYVKGVKNGIDNEKPVRIYVMGINEWRDEEAWPLKRTKYTSFYLGCKMSANSLHGDGFLSAKMESKKDGDKYIYNPEDPVRPIGGTAGLYDQPDGPYDQTPMEIRNDVLVYTSEKLKKPVEVTGYINVELYVSSDAPDTDFVARLCDVYPDGRSIILNDGIIRSRYREGIDKEVMLQKNKVYKLEISLDCTSNVFLKEHCIRLEITSSCFPKYIRNTNTGGDIISETKFKTARQTVYHSKTYPSKVILPVIP